MKPLKNPRPLGRRVVNGPEAFETLDMSQASINAWKAMQ
jgi:hypothetical protein